MDALPLYQSPTLAVPAQTFDFAFGHYAEYQSPTSAVPAQTVLVGVVFVGYRINRLHWRCRLKLRTFYHVEVNMVSIAYIGGAGSNKTPFVITLSDVVSIAYIGGAGSNSYAGDISICFIVSIAYIGGAGSNRAAHA